ERALARSLLLSNQFKPNLGRPKPKNVARKMAIQLITSITALLAIMLPATAAAQFTYTTNNGGLTITGYTGTGGVVAIPTSINGLAVRSIGNSAFSNKTSIT